MIVAATIGNVLEWFDFLVYGFFAATLAQVFFPAHNPTVSLLITFGAFGLSYLARPLGAAVIGTYTDRAGRRAGLTLSITLTMLGTTLMVVTPGYATIGIAAPVIITFARLLRGIRLYARGAASGIRLTAGPTGEPRLAAHAPHRTSRPDHGTLRHERDSLTWRTDRQPTLPSRIAPGPARRPRRIAQTGQPPPHPPHRGRSRHPGPSHPGAVRQRGDAHGRTPDRSLHAPH